MITLRIDRTITYMYPEINQNTFIEILPIISKRILLTESRRNLKGQCPFHDDQATSLMVSPD
ncbi:hypothetical protein GSY63_02935 [Mucilaginibacter sp. R11]|uniref:Zinc finger CHC2-type domain-containing protein n=1 Tax=Mucilaginibacter agri TaxID=2695265 RepID=A0A965ZCN7_9SPHI|nr:hypothetical protein [Mucilaginibacter agri]